VRVGCPSVSSCGPYYWGTGALLSLVTVYGRDSVCLVWDLCVAVGVGV
jgi:hypothetical protein